MIVSREELLIKPFNAVNKRKQWLEISMRDSLPVFSKLRVLFAPRAPGIEPAPRGYAVSVGR